MRVYCRYFNFNYLTGFRNFRHLFFDVVKVRGVTSRWYICALQGYAFFPGKVEGLLVSDCCNMKSNANINR